MKQFVVAYLSFFDNELKMQQVFAADAVSALRSSFYLEGYEFPDNATVEDIQRTMFECDVVIGVMEVNCNAAATAS